MSYTLPPTCRAESLALFDKLRGLTMEWLGEISHYLCGDRHLLARLAEEDTGPATMRAIHYDRVPELAAQLESLSTDMVDQGVQALRDVWPVHTDGTLLTLAPRGTVPGLAVREYESSQWLSIEDQMVAGDAVLFCGDALSYCSCHLFPALMHQPDGVTMARSAPQRRLTCPLFLYADTTAILDATQLRPELVAEHAQRIQQPVPSTLPASHLPLNTGKCRDRWPWKRETYYEGLRMSRD